MPCSILLSCWTAETSGQVEIMTSQPTGGQTPKWLQIFHMSLLVTIAKTRSRKFEGVTLSGSLTRFRFPLDQPSSIWQCFGEYLQPWTSNISKYLKICIFVQIVVIAQYLDVCLSKHVKWVDQSEEPAPVRVCCFDKYLWPWQYSKCWEITTWSGCLWVKFCWSMCVCVRCESCFS